MALILEIEESENDIISGIPQFVLVSTNIPSNIYYTFDGSEPNTNSLIAVNKILLPTDLSRFTFRCIAFDGEEYSSEFSKDYSVSQSDVKNTRKGNESGVTVLEYLDEALDSFGFGYDQESAQEMSKVRHSFDFVTSVTNDQGEEVSSTKTFINFVEEKIDVSRQGSDTPNNDNVYFDPRAKVIVVDGTSEDKLNDQSVRLINRPHDTFNASSKFYEENDGKYKNIISGNLTKYAYDNRTGELTFYYYESNESRWIISKQKVSPKKYNFGKTPRNRSGGRYVFQWIQDPVMSKLR